MILPTKHIPTERSLLGVGAEILALLVEERTVSDAWDAYRTGRGAADGIATVPYDWFILALDLLFALDAVRFDRGVLRLARL